MADRRHNAPNQRVEQTGIRHDSEVEHGESEHQGGRCHLKYPFDLIVPRLGPAPARRPNAMISAEIAYIRFVLMSVMNVGLDTGTR